MKALSLSLAIAAVTLTTGCDDDWLDLDGDTSPLNLQVSADAKTLKFTWESVDGITHYQLMSDPDGSSGFTQVGNDIATTATSIDITISAHLLDWSDARYILESCNGDSCQQSDQQSISSLILDAILYAKSSNSGTGDELGFSVALSEDGTTLAVGAPLEDGSSAGINQDSNDNRQNSGAVYVFRNTSGTWAQEAYIKSADPDVGDQFGYALALSDNGNTLAISANLEDSNATGVGNDSTNNGDTDSGAVFVYTRSGTTWSQQTYIKASTTDPNDNFGGALDLNGDGTTLVVGANSEDSDDDLGETNNGATDSGAVYVFTLNAGTWSQQAFLKSDNSDPNDNFGESVSLSADGNTLAVGAPEEDSNATGVENSGSINNSGSNNDVSGSGAVYIFTRSGTTWSEAFYVKASNTGNGDRFGNAISLSGDSLTLAVGAENEDSSATGIGGSQTNNSASDSGAVYVFTRTSDSWEQKSYFKASNTRQATSFGTSVALDENGRYLAVGSPFEASSVTGVGDSSSTTDANNSGGVYFFTLDNGSWQQTNFIKASNTNADDNFGTSLALSDDGSALAVGAIGEASKATGISGDQTDNSQATSGAVYVY